MTLPLAAQCAGERVPSQLTLTTEVEPKAGSTGTISSPSSTSSVTVSLTVRASASQTGRAASLRSASPRTALASCTRRPPSRYLAVRRSRSTRPWRSSVASSRSAVERWTPSSRATSAPAFQPPTASTSRIATARAMQGALVILRPLIAETGAKPVGRYVIGTVKGDIHDIGKNLCVIMLEGAGFEVFDLGVNTPPEKFVDAVKTHEPDIVGFSAFLTTTMPMFKANIEALQKAGLRDKVHVAVGGAPVTEEYAKHVGADSYAPDASMATRMAKHLVGDRSGQSQGAQALEQAVMKIDETLRKG